MSGGVVGKAKAGVGRCRCGVGECEEGWSWGVLRCEGDCMGVRVGGGGGGGVE